MLGEHGFEVEGGVDAEDGRAKGCGRLARRLDFPHRSVGLRHGLTFPDSVRIIARPGTGIAVPRVMESGEQRRKPAYFYLNNIKKPDIHTIILYIILLTKG